MKRKTEQKENEATLRKEKGRMCSVCRKEIHEMNLPDAQCVVEENLCDEGSIYVIGSEVLLLVLREHQCKGVGVSNQGECAHYEVTDIRVGGW